MGGIPKFHLLTISVSYNSPSFLALGPAPDLVALPPPGVAGALPFPLGFLARWIHQPTVHLIEGIRTVGLAFRLAPPTFAPPSTGAVPASTPFEASSS